MANKKDIKARKREHLKLATSEKSCYQSLSTGLEEYQFIHCALPELDFSEIETQASFLGYQLALPLIINPISGGEETGRKLNRDLAQVAAQAKVALSLGSMRAALENPNSLKSYKIVEDYVADIPLIVNIGCLQLKDQKYVQAMLNLCEELDADAVSIHLNPLQEILQPEGGQNFKNVLKAIENFIILCDLPVIVKEVGFGISLKVAKALIKIGIEWIDISGSGGTCWSRIETQRLKNSQAIKVAEEFAEWGIPTAKSLQDLQSLPNIRLIASGGIRSGLDLAKSLALGSEMAGVAGAVLQSWDKKGQEGLQKLIENYKQTLKICLFSTGCKDIKKFQGNEKIITKVH